MGFGVWGLGFGVWGLGTLLKDPSREEKGRKRSIFRETRNAVAWAAKMQSGGWQRCIIGH